MFGRGQHDLSTDRTHNIEDSMIVRRDYYTGYGGRRSSPFDGVRDQRTTRDREQKLAWQTDRRVPRRYDRNYNF